MGTRQYAFIPKNILCGIQRLIPRCGQAGVFRFVHINLFTVSVAFALQGDSAAAAEPFAKEIKARKAVMRIQASNFGTFGAMAKGKMRYDATVAQRDRKPERSGLLVASFTYGQSH